MTDQALLSELLSALAARRAAAVQDAKDRKEAFAKENPEFRALLERERVYPEKLFSLLDKADAQEQIRKIKREYADLKAQEAKLMKQSHLAPDAFLPRYTCEKCSDTGYLGARMCSCLKTQYNRALAKKSGLGGLFEKQSFESFDPERIADPKARESMREILSDLKDYAAHFSPETAANLLLMGGTGVGKTHLSSAIGKAVLERGFEVLYDGAANLIGQMEAEHFSHDPTIKSERPRTERILNCELLIIDDLGTEFYSQNATQSFLFQLINTRLVEHRPTILSTNLKPKELEARYGERLTSRLFGEYAVYLFSGEDQRRNG